MSPLVPALAVTVVAHVINGPEALEPSVLNEIDRALAVAPCETCGTNAVGPVVDVFATNGLAASAVAIRLVSLQRSDGSWFVGGTNCTAEAVRILSALQGERR